MIFEFFLMLLIIGIALTFLGHKMSQPLIMSLGFIVILLLGLLISVQGLQWQTGNFTIDANTISGGTIFSGNYEYITLTPTNDFTLMILVPLMIFPALIGMVASLAVLIKGK